MSLIGDNYPSFLQLHEQQLKASGLPNTLWETLFSKLTNGVYDAGNSFAFETSDSGSSQYSVVALQDIAANSAVYLVNHLVTFSDTQKLLQHLKSDVHLLVRLAQLMEAPEALVTAVQEQHVEEDAVLQLHSEVVASLPSYTYEFAVQSTPEQQKLDKVKYIMDEVGNRFGTASEQNAANISLCAFLWAQPEGTMTDLSIAWPISGIKLGEAVIREGKVGMANYSDKKYWEKRFGFESASDWYLDYKHFQSLISRHCLPTAKAVVLVPGCGNSKLGVDMRDAGYGNVHNADYIEAVVERAAREHGREGGLHWCVADLTKRTHWADGTFNAIVDKATMDAMLSTLTTDQPWKQGEEAEASVSGYLAELHRVLAPGGVLVLVTLRSPGNLYPLLQQDALREQGRPWDIEECQEYSSTDGKFTFYVYICKQDTDSQPTAS